MMVETIEKATVLEKVQRAYEQLNTLLAPLSEEQKTTPGVKRVSRTPARKDDVTWQADHSRLSRF